MKRVEVGSEKVGRVGSEEGGGRVGGGWVHSLTLYLDLLLCVRVCVCVCECELLSEWVSE